MTDSDVHDQIHNRLLLSLPPITLERLRPALSRVTTTRAQTLDHVDRPIEYMHFVDQGLVSFVKTMHDGRSVEVRTVGIEGVTDPNALFGMGEAVTESVVQIPGAAYRITRDVLMREMDVDADLRAMMQRYALFAIRQIVQTAACNRLHTLEERCCRWLLIAHDSVLANTFPLTHEYLAMMLGVQRAGVSVTANFLQKAGLIRYTRGRVTITNRPGLEDAACECYGSIRAESERLFGIATRK